MPGALHTLTGLWAVGRECMVEQMLILIKWFGLRAGGWVAGWSGVILASPWLGGWRGDGLGYRGSSPFAYEGLPTLSNGGSCLLCPGRCTH